ncbi:AAA family ATPase [Candidatus Woesebacteria bacterium]|nr:AAA family ATPase [Candidatus Woesebacteria bacterium]
MDHHYKYKNITISGLPGGGSTTLLRLLREELSLDGWRGFSGGEFMRQYALEHGSFAEQKGLHHDSSHYSDDFDRLVDMDMREKLHSQEKWIIESWLSGFLAQGLEGVLKVLVICSEDAIRIDRIVNRDNVTIQEAKENMRKRYDQNLAKWSRMYAPEWKEWVVETGACAATEPINFWRPELYDLVIDTYSTNREQTLTKVVNLLKGNE